VLSEKYIHHNWLHIHYLQELYLECGESPDIQSLVWTSTNPGLVACMKWERVCYEISDNNWWTGRNTKAFWLVLLPGWSRNLKLMKQPRFRLLVVTPQFGGNIPYLANYKTLFLNSSAEECGFP
jgi:hypothetical protein